MMAEIRQLGEYVGEQVTVRGWIEATRGHGKVAFTVVRDGTGVLQGVLLKANVSEATWELQQSLTQESVVALTGEVKEDDRAPGGYELGVTAVELLSAADEYPIQKKEHGVEFLLDKRHLWLRSSMQRAGLRVRAEVEQSIHDFLYNNDFVRIDTPILTGAIGEHAGTLFETDYFGQSAYLAQTGQLYVEAACPAFKRVYSFGPTFRAEKSKTRRHLTEFWMVEPEVAFADSDANMELQEQFVSYIIERALEPLRRRGVGAGVARLDDVTRQRVDALAAHRILLVGHRRAADLLGLARLFDLALVGQEAQVVGELTRRLRDRRQHLVDAPIDLAGVGLAAHRDRLLKAHALSDQPIDLGDLAMVAPGQQQEGRLGARCALDAPERQPIGDAPDLVEVEC